MLELTHKLKLKNNEVNPVTFTVDPEFLDYEFVRKFSRGSQVDKTSEELDQLNLEAAGYLKKYKTLGTLQGYDFRHLNKYKRGYLNLANLIAVSVWRKTKEQFSRSSSAGSFAPSLGEPKSKDSDIPVDQIFKKSISQNSVSSAVDLVQNLKSNLKEENFDNQNLGDLVKMSTSTSPTTQNNDLSSYLRSLPHHHDDMLFENFVNKLISYFDVCDIVDDKKKIKLLKYSIAEKPTLHTAISSITVEESPNFAEFANECIELLDGRIKATEGEIYSTAWTYRLSHFSNLKEYFHAYVALKSSAKNPASIDEASLIESFLRGLSENLSMICRNEIAKQFKPPQKPKLLDVYKIAKTAKPEQSSASKLSLNVVKTNSKYNNFNKNNQNNYYNPRNNQNYNPRNNNYNFRNNNQNSYNPNRNNNNSKNINRQNNNRNANNSNPNRQNNNSNKNYNRRRNNNRNNNSRANYRVNNLKEDEYSEDEYDERVEEGQETVDNGDILGDSKNSNNGNAITILEAEQC